MKQVYYFIFLMLLAFSSVNVKADTPVKINIDDVNRVTVKVNYVPVANLVNGTNGSVLKPSCKPILLSTQFHKPI